jgi:hypothetical protein
MSGTITASRSGGHATTATTTPVDQSVRPAADAAETFVDEAVDTLVHEAVGTLVVAFAADPMIRWLLPEGARYVAHFPRLLRLVGDVASGTGAVDTVGGGAGAALWIAPGTQLPEEEFAGLLQQSVEAASLEDAFALLEQTDLHHPAEPHWYLPFIESIRSTRAGATGPRC